MKFSDIINIINSFKKEPIKTLLLVFLILIILCISAYLSNYFGQKGKNLADTAMDSSLVTPSSKGALPQDTITNKIEINQNTKGSQSPAVNVGPEGTVNFNYKSSITGKSHKE